LVYPHTQSLLASPSELAQEALQVFPAGTLVERGAGAQYPFIVSIEIAYPDAHAYMAVSNVAYAPFGFEKYYTQTFWLQTRSFSQNASSKNPHSSPSST
jgi:hypothetical protein